MKFIKTAAFVLLLSTAFIACKKDNDTPAPFTIEGAWKGQTGNGGFFGLNIKPGGVLERISSGGAVSATGTWEMNGNTLTGDYTFTSGGTIVEMTATIDQAKNKMTGTWSNNGGEIGTLTAEKDFN